MELLAQVDDAQKKLQNAGMIGNWVAFAQMERDDRIDIDGEQRNSYIRVEIINHHNDPPTPTFPPHRGHR